MALAIYRAAVQLDYRALLGMTPVAVRARGDSSPSKLFHVPLRRTAASRGRASHPLQVLLSRARVASIRVDVADELAREILTPLVARGFQLQVEITQAPRGACEAPDSCRPSLQPRRRAASNTTASVASALTAKVSTAGRRGVIGAHVHGQAQTRAISPLGASA